MLSVDVYFGTCHSRHETTRMRFLMLTSEKERKETRTSRGRKLFLVTTHKRSYDFTFSELCRIEIKQAIVDISMV